MRMLNYKGETEPKVTTSLRTWEPIFTIQYYYLLSDVACILYKYIAIQKSQRLMY